MAAATRSQCPRAETGAIHYTHTQYGIRAHCNQQQCVTGQRSPLAVAGECEWRACVELESLPRRLADRLDHTGRNDIDKRSVANRIAGVVECDLCRCLLTNK
jgi:hypothetical protein